MSRRSLCLTLAVLAATQVLAAEEPPEPVGSSIVVQNYYWAKDGLAEEVYRHRLHASEVRASLGLFVGRVLRRLGESDALPDVIWECEYPDAAARQADLDALSESGRFEPVMEKMGSLIERFDRAVWSVGEPEVPPLGE